MLIPFLPLLFRPCDFLIAVVILFAETPAERETVDAVAPALRCLCAQLDLIEPAYYFRGPHENYMDYVTARSRLSFPVTSDVHRFDGYSTEWLSIQVIELNRQIVELDRARPLWPDWVNRIDDERRGIQAVIDIYRDAIAAKTSTWPSFQRHSLNSLRQKLDPWEWATGNLP